MVSKTRSKNSKSQVSEKENFFYNEDTKKFFQDEQGNVIKKKREW